MDFEKNGLLILVGWSESLQMDKKLVYLIINTLHARGMTHFVFSTPRNFVKEIRTIFTAEVLGKKLLLPEFTPQ